jgi:glycosyltransferase involved in cell wall biosynthesis
MPTCRKRCSTWERLVDVLYIVVPAYNESDNIEQFVDDWYPIVESHNTEGLSRLVIVNDGSKDDTYEKLVALAKGRPLLQPLTKPNGGHGPALIFGYTYAIEHGADYIFQTDSDGQTNPDEFEGFWKRREANDAILGVRSNREDGNDRKFVERTLCRILHAIFGITVPDANAPFRLMRAGLVASYLKKLPPDYNLPNVMLTVYFSYFGNRLAFREISFRPRQGGTNSINPKKIIGIGWKALGDFRELKLHIND